jgi:hypothetical protein
MKVPSMHQTTTCRNLLSVFIDVFFTTFMDARFTNTFDEMARAGELSCVLRGCIAD